MVFRTTCISFLKNLVSRKVAICSFLANLIDRQIEGLTCKKDEQTDKQIVKLVFTRASRKKDAQNDGKAERQTEDE